MAEPLTIEQQVLSNSQATIVQLSLRIGDRIITTSGTSKRCRGDSNDPAIALSLAYGRAFQSLGQRLEHLGNRMVERMDAAHTAAERPVRRRPSRQTISTNGPSRNGDMARVLDHVRRQEGSHVAKAGAPVN